MWWWPLLAASLAATSVTSVTSPPEGWTARAFPDIRGPAWRACSARHAEKFTLYVCDPDGFLNATAEAALNRRLVEVANVTPCHCQRRSQCETDDSQGQKIYRGFVVSLALLRRIDMEAHDPSPEELAETADKFSRTLRGRWALGDCGNSALILYWSEYNLLHISTGRLTKLYLTPSEASVMRAQVEGRLGRGDIGGGLLSLLEAAEVELRGKPEVRVDTGTLSLIISVVVASVLVCIITGCVCAFRCCGNMRASPETRVGRALERVESVKQGYGGLKGVIRRGSQLRRSFSRSPKFTHSPAAANPDYLRPDQQSHLLGYYKEAEEGTSMV